MLDIYYSYVKKEQSKDLIKHIFKKYYNFDLNQDQISLGKNGKPYLKSGEYFYNLTHTDGLVMLAVSDKEVGIDAEKFRDHDFSKVIEKYATSGEKQRILTNKDFLCLWTKKESFVKYLGGNAITDAKTVTFEQNYPVFKGEKQDVNTFSIGLNEHVFSVTSPYNEYDNFTLIL